MIDEYSQDFDAALVPRSVKLLNLHVNNLHNAQLLSRVTLTALQIICLNGFTLDVGNMHGLVYLGIDN